MKIYNVEPHGILYVGAHHAEENAEYREISLQGSGKIFWVEAQRELVELIKQKLDMTKNKVICAVVWGQDDIEFVFNITFKTASSSLFDFGTHAEQYPEITVTEKRKVRTVRLDSILKNEDFFQLVVLDIQGAELQALKGLGDFVLQVNWIFTEVSKSPLYKNSPLVGDMDTYLETLDFIRVFTELDRRAGWGDALYVRRSVFQQTFKQKILVKLSETRRLIRSYLPQWIFPILVYLKRMIKAIFR